MARTVDFCFFQKRQALEESSEMEPRVSALEEDLENLSSSSSEDEAEKSPVRVIPHGIDKVVPHDTDLLLDNLFLCRPEVPYL